MLESILNGFIAILIGLAALFYNILETLANLFSDLTLLKIMSSDLLVEIYRRIGLILALYMLLKLTISGIQMIVNPDLITDKERGVKKILVRIIVAILLLGFIPYIFNKAFYLQEMILEEGIISKIVLGENVSSDNFGNEFAPALFVSAIENQDDAKVFETELKYNYEDYSSGADYFDSIGSAFMCLLIGIFACWMFLTYTISLAIRVIQLCFLEIISPVPIMSSISAKKDTALSGWIKQCLATYIDVFIRLFIIYLLILIERLIMSGEITMLSGGTYNAVLIIKILLMLGVLLFAKKAPDLIKELFPGLKTKAAGDLGFGLKSRTDIPDPARRLIGAGLGAPIGAIGRIATRTGAMALQNKIDLEKGIINKKQATGRMAKALGTGLLTGIGGGIVGGLTAKKGVLGGINKDARAKMASSNSRFVSNQTKGYTVDERFEDYMANKLGFKNYVQQLKTEKFGYDAAKVAVKRHEDLKSFLTKEADNDFKTAKYMQEGFTRTENGRRAQEAGLERSRLTNIVEEYSNPNSARYIQYQKDISDPTKNREEIEREFIKEKENAKLQLEEQVKKYNDLYITFVTSQEAVDNGVQNAAAIREIDQTEKEDIQHNEIYRGIDSAQINYKLKKKQKNAFGEDMTGFRFKDLDNYIKGKANYEYDPDPNSEKHKNEKGAAYIRKEAELNLQRIEAEIKDREDKMSGNKTGK